MQPGCRDPLGVGPSGRDGLCIHHRSHILVLNPSPVPAPIRVLVFGCVKGQLSLHATGRSLLRCASWYGWLVDGGQWLCPTAVSLLLWGACSHTTEVHIRSQSGGRNACQIPAAVAV